MRIAYYFLQEQRKNFSSVKIFEQCIKTYKTCNVFIKKIHITRRTLFLREKFLPNIQFCVATSVLSFICIKITMLHANCAFYSSQKSFNIWVNQIDAGIRTALHRTVNVVLSGYCMPDTSILMEPWSDRHVYS